MSDINTKTSHYNTYQQKLYIYSQKIKVMKKIKNLLFFGILVFGFSSCQKCMECTNEKLFNNQEGEMVFELEICEDDFGSKDEMENYVDMMEEQDGVRCYKNLW